MMTKTARENCLDEEEAKRIKSLEQQLAAATENKI